MNSEDDDGPETPQRMAQRQRRWVHRILTQAPVPEAHRAQYKHKHPNDDDECDEFAVLGYTG